MSHFAKVENGLVTEVIVAKQEIIDSGLFGDPNLWVQTSYNTYGNEHPENRPLRANYAGIGYTYDRTNDVFYGPQPYSSWILNRNTWLWEAPTPKPISTDNRTFYSWDEDSISWVAITLPE
jgi:hypothetical protein